MFSLEGDKMTAFWPRDNLTLTFYVIISNILLNWTTFVKEVFWSVFSIESDLMTALWSNNNFLL